MQTRLFWMALFWAWMGTLRADLVIVERVQGQTRTGVMSLRFHADKVRVDLAPELSTITDTTTGEVLTLMHPTRSFMRFSGENLRSLAVQKDKLRTGAETPKMVSSGKQERIGGVQCELYTWKNGGLNATYWIARDYPHYDRIRDSMERLQNSGYGVVTRGIGPEVADFPGMVLQSELVVGRQKVVTTVEAVTEEEVDSGVFEVPVDYRELIRPRFD